MAIQIKYKWSEVHLLDICGKVEQAPPCVFHMQPYFVVGQHRFRALLFNRRLQ